MAKRMLWIAATFLLVIIIAAQVQRRRTSPYEVASDGCLHAKPYTGPETDTHSYCFRYVLDKRDLSRTVYAYEVLHDGSKQLVKTTHQKREEYIIRIDRLKPHETITFNVSLR